MMRKLYVLNDCSMCPSVTVRRNWRGAAYQIDCNHTLESKIVWEGPPLQMESGSLMYHQADFSFPDWCPLFEAEPGMYEEE